MVDPPYAEEVQIIEHLVVDVTAVAGLVVLLAVIALAAATTLMLRRLRRLAAASTSLATTLTSAQWWATQQERRRMWRAVTAAKHAVAVARRAQAPVGDLPTLASQLETAARCADALARATAHSPRGTAVASTDVRRVEEAALQMHRAAVDSLQLIANSEVSPLLPSVRLEAQAVAAGIRAVGALRRPVI